MSDNCGRPIDIACGLLQAGPCGMHREVAALRDANIEWKRQVVEKHREVAALRAVVDAFEDVCLGHGCGLEGYDEACRECRAVKAMDAYRGTGHA